MTYTWLLDFRLRKHHTTVMVTLTCLQFELIVLLKYQDKDVIHYYCPKVVSILWFCNAYHIFSNRSNETTFMRHVCEGITQGIFQRPHVSTVSTDMFSGVGESVRREYIRLQVINNKK